jgi:hypothetical protein
MGKNCRRIENTVAKRCLMAGKPLQIEGGNLVVGFSNNFNKDKLFVPDLLAASEQAIADELGVRMSLKGIVDEKLAVRPSFKEDAPLLRRNSLLPIITKFPSKTGKYARIGFERVWRRSSWIIKLYVNC